MLPVGSRRRLDRNRRRLDGDRLRLLARQPQRAASEQQSGDENGWRDGGTSGRGASTVPDAAPSDKRDVRGPARFDKELDATLARSPGSTGPWCLVPVSRLVLLKLSASET